MRVRTSRRRGRTPFAVCRSAIDAPTLARDWAEKAPCKPNGDASPKPAMRSRMSSHPEGAVNMKAGRVPGVMYRVGGTSMVVVVVEMGTGGG